MMRRLPENLRVWCAVWLQILCVQGFKQHAKRETLGQFGSKVLGFREKNAERRQNIERKRKSWRKKAALEEALIPFF